MLKFIIILPVFMASLVYAQETNVSSREEVETHPLSANFNLTYNALSNSNGQSLSGPGLELHLLYALKEKWGVGMGIKQMALGSAGSASAVNFRLTYAITGSLLREDKKIYYDKDLVVEKKSIESPCLCVQFLGSQYFLNATQTTVPFTGFGGSVYYKYPTKSYSSLIGGVSYESVTNDNTVTALSFIFGLEFRI